jgi:hypothetical protein
MRASASKQVLLTAAAAATQQLLLQVTLPGASARPLPHQLGGYNSDAAVLTLQFYTK